MLTDKTRIKSRPATRADVVEFYDELPPQTIRARVLDDGGRVVGIAGYYIADGVSVVFSESKVGINKMTAWREALSFMKDVPGPAICLASEGSHKFLEKLGWTFLGTTEDGDVYQWQN